MPEKEDNDRQRTKKRERRKKRRRAGSSYQPMRESVVIFTLFIVLAGIIVFCFWTIIPTALAYFRETLGF
jgi:cell division septal protein FtsQ